MNRPAGLSIFAIVGIPFLVIGLTSQREFLPFGIAFLAIGVGQTAAGMNRGKSDRKAGGKEPDAEA